MSIPLLALATGLVLAGGVGAQSVHYSCPRVRISPVSAHRVVRYLTQPALEGRAFGSHGAWCASGLVAALFQYLGLRPAGAQGFFHPVTEGRAEDPPRNVVGLLPGTDTGLADEVIVVGAHHDHLGSAGETILPGADDNASGVAALLLVAQSLAEGEGLPRSVLFVTFSGEEVGFRGSRSFLARPPVPLDRVAGMVNLDMVGRLEDGGLTLDGWSHLPTGVRRILTRGRIRIHPEGTPVADSDGRLFAQAGVPTVTFFTGYHADYHRPTDTLDRLDLRGIRTVADVAASLVRSWATSGIPGDPRTGR